MLILAVSIRLPLEFNEHGFKQAPLEEIDEGTYLEMRKTVTPITSIAQLEMDEVEIDDCEGGACPVR